VEFTLIAPALGMIIFAMVDVGSAAFQYIEPVQALSAGSSYAMNHSSDTSGIQAAVTAARISAARSSGRTGLTRHARQSIGGPYRIGPALGS
jgi:Flp pilus assembly protein TadG